MLRRVLLGMSRSPQIKKAVSSLPVSSGIVARFVAGETAPEAVLATEKLVSNGLDVTLDYLGEDAPTWPPRRPPSRRTSTCSKQLAAAGLTRNAEVSVKLSAVGQALPGDGDKIALENARTICRAARNAGTTVTLDMEDHTTTDSTLGILRELRKDFPETGAVLQAYLRRTEADCRDLAHEGSRVRLCKGAYKEPEAVAFQDAARRRQVVRALPEGADGRPGLPDDRDARPAADRDRRRARGPPTAATRAATSTRCSSASAPRSSGAWPRRARPCASTSRTARSGTATSCAASPSAREPAFFLRSLISKK